MLTRSYQLEMVMFSAVSWLSMSTRPVDQDAHFPHCRSAATLSDRASGRGSEFKPTGARAPLSGPLSGLDAARLKMCVERVEPPAQ